MKNSIVALVTPMLADNQIDYVALEHLLTWHREQKTEGVVILGSTGEAATVRPDERVEIIKRTVAHANKSYPVIVGTGTQSTESTIELTQQAKDLGADAALIVTPYYNKPTQEGLYQHYRHIAEAVDLPILLYNVPGRTACDLKPETVIRLASIPNIIGIKEATGEIDRVSVLRKACGNDFLLLTGDDFSALDFLAAGGNGNISAVANVIPHHMQRLCEAALNGDGATAHQLNQQITGLIADLFIETNPIAIKWALWRMGKIDTGIRLPLTWLSAKHQAKLTEQLQITGILLSESM